MSELLRWFTGGADYAYTTLVMCMRGDMLWVWHLLASKTLIFASYMLVAHYLFRRWRTIRKTRFARTFLYGSLVFVNCASLHLLNGLESFWPGRRLEALMGYSVAGINLLFVFNLYRIRALENILKINVVRRQGGGSDATSE